MARRRLDIALRRDAAVRSLPWLIAAMAYLAALALAGTLALDGTLQRWNRNLTGILTVEIPPGGDAPVEAALTLLRATPGVAHAEALDRSATERLIEPWLGTGLSPEELALPRLIDVRLAPGGIDRAALKAKLEAAAPGARLDDHRAALDRFAGLARALEAVAAAILLLIGAAAVLTVILATRAGLAVHSEVIDLLHLMGAPDGDIARQFQRAALWLGLKGGSGGLVAAAATLVALHQVATAAGVLAGDGVALLPALEVAPWRWAALLLLPPAAAVIAMLAARLTVMRALAKLP
jgi:cell division transport system permease protein